MQNNTSDKETNKILYSAKECAYVAVFTGLLIAVQLVLSALPGIELVTLLLVTFSFTMGVHRSIISATLFSLLRQFIFGFSPTVLILYLIFYNLLCLCFGLLGKRLKANIKGLIIVVVATAIISTLFTLLDDIITPLYLGYSLKATKAYFFASLPVMAIQTACASISVFCLFLPLNKVFEKVKKTLVK